MIWELIEFSHTCKYGGDERKEKLFYEDSRQMKERER